MPRVELWNKGIDTEVFHPKHGSRPWWLAKQAAAGAAAISGDDLDELASAAHSMRVRLTNGKPDAPLLIYAGRLGVEKRLRDLKKLLARLPDARLAIIGQGPDSESLQAHFGGTHTVFTGLLSGVELSQAFATADVFVMPSDSETLGFVVLEAMASGVPVVACNRGGIPSLLDHSSTGFLYEPGDTHQLAEYVTRLIDDRPFADKMSASARVEAERWGWESATTRLREEQYLLAVRNHRQRQADVRSLRQKLQQYRDTLFRGSRADLFALFGDRSAEREAEELEKEAQKLVDDIHALDKKPTTRHLLGWLSARSTASLRLTTILLFPWRLLTSVMRKLRKALLLQGNRRQPSHTLGTGA